MRPTSCLRRRSDLLETTTSDKQVASEVVGDNKSTAYIEQLEDFDFSGPQKRTSAREIVESWDDWSWQLKGNGVSWDEEDELYHNPVELRQ
jgi:hypothetical protein